jgi:hypothetical protein
LRSASPLVNQHLCTTGAWNCCVVPQLTFRGTLQQSGEFEDLRMLRICVYVFARSFCEAACVVKT